MALSILPLNSSRTLFGIWCSEKKRWIDSGSQFYCEKEKHRMEEEQQQADNKKEIDRIYQERLQMARQKMSEEEAVHYVRQSLGRE